ncbi:MAG: hypothetical protein AAFY46_05060 [Planctomycetota bacterium]
MFGDGPARDGLQGEAKRPIGQPANYIEDVYIDSDGSVSGLTFGAILANVVEPAARTKA